MHQERVVLSLYTLVPRFLLLFLLQFDYVEDRHLLNVSVCSHEPIEMRWYLNKKQTVIC